MQRDWSSAETEYAIKHWLDGKPAADVARMLNATFGTNRSRNSIIGRINRLGHSRAAPSGPRQSTLDRKAERKALRASNPPKVKFKAEFRQYARKLSPPKPLPAPAVILADVSFARPWLERGRGQCAFPLGERHAVMSCCFPTEETYCAAHRQAMGGKRKPWVNKDFGKSVMAA